MFNKVDWVVDKFGQVKAIEPYHRPRPILPMIMPVPSRG